MAGADNSREIWDGYWLDLSGGGFGIYQAISAFDLKSNIQPSIDEVLAQTFTPDAGLLHASCGEDHMYAKSFLASM